MIKTKKTGTDISLGCTLTDDSTHFAFYCPRAASVNCILYNHCDDEEGQKYKMNHDEGGIWRLTINKNLYQ